MTSTNILPALYDSVVVHTRLERIHRSFRHRIYLWLVDLDDLPALPGWLRPLAGFNAEDHLGWPEGSIRHNLDCWLASRGIDLAGGRVVMLAAARSLGHVFNPITLYWCSRPDGSAECVVAEVHNTYGDRHAYLLRPDEHGRAQVAKEFYVSPYLSVGGSYEMRIGRPGPTVSVEITLHQEGRAVFAASLQGVREPVTRRRLLGMLLRHPLGGYRVPALIRLHGVTLWLRRLPIKPRPSQSTKELK
jgi:uncharacterized protein